MTGFAQTLFEIESSSIILNLQAQGAEAVLRQEVNLVRLRVSNGIVGRFLRDPEQFFLDLDGKRAWPSDDS
jgi:hypothetical protein